MKPIDKLLFGLLFGFSFPVLFFLIALTLWFCFFQNYNVLHFVITGLIIGILSDILFLRKLVSITFELPVWVLIVLYLFYNICIYGIFMGFPVFNLGMGIVAGYYYGIKINFKSFSLTQIEFLKKRVPMFSSLIMFLICLSTGLIALHEKTMGEELQGMFKLEFQVTEGMIISIIVTGGLVLIVSQYYLTRIILIKTIKQRLNLT